MNAAFLGPLCGLGVLLAYLWGPLFFSRFFYTSYLVEDREFSAEGAAREYLASFTDDVPRRVIRRRRFRWGAAP
jgi:hypothetical protein